MNRRLKSLCFSSLAAAAWLVPLTAAEFPEAEISNGQIRAKLYLPDPEKGYYRATRFDWSGAVSSLEYKGHQYFGVWFPKHDPKINDAITGPVEEFRTGDSALGYDEAKPGGTFIRIGVGVLRKPEEPRFQQFKTYEIVDPGTWKVQTNRDSVAFTHQVADGNSGYAYEYRKVVRLAGNAPQMIIEHVLKNTGKKTIQTNAYNHNFFVIDGQPTGPDFVVKMPFEAQAKADLQGIAEVKGKELRYLQQMPERRNILTEITGYGPAAKDYDFRIENTKVGAGVRIRSDRPMSKLMFWSPRTTLCPEPYIEMQIEPGREHKWRFTYDFYTLPAAGSQK